MDPSSGYAFWTYGHWGIHGHNRGLWPLVWGNEAPLDPTLVCDTLWHGYAYNYFYLDGSGCLRTGRYTGKKFLALVSDNYVIPTNWTGLTDDVSEYDEIPGEKLQKFD